MKQILLTQKKFASVDDADYIWLNRWKWCLTAGYAARANYSSGKRNYIYMHKLIMNPHFYPQDNEIDHINGNKLDNQRSNLRIATRSQNMANTNLKSTNTSGAKGVSWDKTRQKWAAEITVDYKKLHLGRYYNLDVAILAYNQAARHYFGEFAKLNIL